MRWGCLAIVPSWLAYGGIGLACSLGAGAPAPAPAPAPPPSPEKTAKPIVAIRKHPRISFGARVGGTLNADQWILGGHFLFESICLPGASFEALLLNGFGGNHLTLRPSLRLGYTLWFGGERGVGVMATAGATAFFLVPVGSFAAFCNRTGLHGCGGHELGIEVGGGLRFRWLRVDAVAAAAGEIPVLTINGALDVPLWSR